MMSLWTCGEASIWGHGELTPGSQYDVTGSQVWAHSDFAVMSISPLGCVIVEHLPQGRPFENSGITFFLIRSNIDKHEFIVRVDYSQKHCREKTLVIVKEGAGSVGAHNPDVFPIIAPQQLGKSHLWWNSFSFCFNSSGVSAGMNNDTSFFLSAANVCFIIWLISLTVTRNWNCSEWKDSPKVRNLWKRKKNISRHFCY